MAANSREQAEEACHRADELFRAGNIRGAHRHAVTAKRLCPSLPAAANAAAVYEIHAAAATKPGNWRAVLGFAGGSSGGAVTRDAVKTRFRRLSLLVHPDKNPSSATAAAEGAFKLLRQAFDDALSSCAEPEEEEPEAAWRRHKFREEERQRKEERRRYKQAPTIRLYKAVFCPFCKHEFVRLCSALLEQEGTECRRCGRWLSPPWQKKPPEPNSTTASEAEQEFPCPAQCPECGTRYAFIVSVGEWCLPCKACGKTAVVDVKGPNLAAINHEFMI